MGEPKSALEKALISEIKCRKKKLFVGLRGLGSVYIDWQHTFPSERLKDRERTEIFEFIKKDNRLNNYSIKIPSKIPHWNILQIKCPIDTYNFLPVKLRTRNGGTDDERALNSRLQQKKIGGKLVSRKDAIKLLDDLVVEENLSDVDKTRFFKEFFISGHYTEQMRWYFSNPSTWANIDYKLKKTLVLRNKFNEEIDSLRTELSQEFPEKGEAYRTRVFNEMNKAFIEGRISDLGKNAFTKNIPEHILNRRRKLDGIHKEVNTYCETEFEKGRMNLLLKTTDVIKPTRPMSHEDVMNQKWLFLDIEVPHYMRQKPDVSWVGMVYYNKGKLNREMHTLSNVNEEKFKNYSMINYANEKKLIEGVKNSILRQDPYFVSAFNARFDLLKLRETEADFSISDRDTEPVIEASAKFFERIGIHGREVIDLFRWAKIVFDYLPNQKLECVAQDILGEERFEKSITYDEMAALEDIALTGKIQVKTEDSGRMEEKVNSLIQFEHRLPPYEIAAKIIADYLASDVDVMPEMFLSEEFQTYLGFATEIGEVLHIPLSWMFYSANTINNSQKKSYFENIGIYRDSVTTRSKKMIQQMTSGKQGFNKLVEDLFSEASKQTKVGVHKNVIKARLSPSYYLKEFIGRRFPVSSKLFSRKGKNDFERNCLSRWSEALTELVIIDYTRHCDARTRIRKTLSNNHIDRRDFFNFYNSVRIELNRESPDRKITESLIKSIIIKGVQEKNKHISSFTQNSPLNNKTITDLITIARKFDKTELKLIGNYKIHPYEIDDALELMKTQIIQWTQEEGLQIVHAEGKYIYLSGADKQTFSKRTHAIPVDGIEALLLTEFYSIDRQGHPRDAKRKIFYEKHGFLKGMKIVKHPTDKLNVFEMHTYGRFITQMLAGNYETAFSEVKKSSETLKKKKVALEDLVLYSKSTDTYSAFEDGKKIFFYGKSMSYDDEIEKIDEEEIRLDEEKNRRYITREIRGKNERVYLMKLSDLKPDWNMYRARNQKKVFDLIYKLRKKSCDDLLEEKILEASDGALTASLETLPLFAGSL